MEMKTKKPFIKCHCETLFNTVIYTCTLYCDFFIQSSSIFALKPAEYFYNSTDCSVGRYI